MKSQFRQIILILLLGLLLTMLVGCVVRREYRYIRPIEEETSAQDSQKIPSQTAKTPNQESQQNQQAKQSQQTMPSGQQAVQPRETSQSQQTQTQQTNQVSTSTTPLQPQSSTPTPTPRVNTVFKPVTFAYWLTGYKARFCHQMNVELTVC